jgi:hypothetical protein
MTKQICRGVIRKARGWIPLALGLAWAIPVTYGYATGFFG